jgi:hypothetical protein
MRLINYPNSIIHFTESEVNNPEANVVTELFFRKLTHAIPYEDSSMLIGEAYLPQFPSLTSHAPLLDKTMKIESFKYCSAQ